MQEMSAVERTEFLEWYDSQRSVLFDNKRVLETYSQDDVTALRQACQVFRREFLQVGNIDVFQESVTITSACNKVLRKLFLKQGTIGLHPTGGYSGNVNYSMKALMWLVYSEQLDGCRTMHGRNGSEYRLPALPRLSVVGFYKETNTVYEFCGCYWHGDTRLPYHDVTTGAGDTFLKLKAEACGYPSWVQSPENEDRYISDFAASESNQLDKDAIGSNPAKRGLAKLCLNSMLGLLAERNDRTRTKMISDQHELYRFLATPGTEVGSLIFANDDVVWVS